MLGKIALAAIFVAFAGTTVRAQKKKPYQRSNTYMEGSASEKAKGRKSGKNGKRGGGLYNQQDYGNYNAYPPAGGSINSAKPAASIAEKFPTCPFYVALKKVEGDNDKVYYRESPDGGYTEPCVPPEYHASISSKDAESLRESVRLNTKNLCNLEQTGMLIGYDVNAVNNFKADESLTVLFCNGRHDEEQYKNCIQEVCRKPNP